MTFASNLKRQTKVVNLKKICGSEHLVEVAVLGYFKAHISLRVVSIIQRYLALSLSKQKKA
jgi:hypothetical protein